MSIISLYQETRSSKVNKITCIIINVHWHLLYPFLKSYVTVNKSCYFIMIGRFIETIEDKTKFIEVVLITRSHHTVRSRIIVRSVHYRCHLGRNCIQNNNPQMMGWSRTVCYFEDSLLT